MSVDGVSADPTSCWFFGERSISPVGRAAHYLGAVVVEDGRARFDDRVLALWEDRHLLRVTIDYEWGELQAIGSFTRPSWHSGHPSWPCTPGYPTKSPQVNGNCAANWHLHRERSQKHGAKRQRCLVEEGVAAAKHSRGGPLLPRKTGALARCAGTCRTLMAERSAPTAAERTPAPPSHPNAAENAASFEARPERIGADRLQTGATVQAPAWGRRPRP